MPNTQLLLKLRELHEELSEINDDLKSSDQIDEETIDALGELVGDVSEIVDQAKVTANTQGLENHYDLVDRIMQFESKHPRVTRFLSQVTDLLAMIGI